MAFAPDHHDPHQTRNTTQISSPQQPNASTFDIQENAANATGWPLNFGGNPQDTIDMACRGCILGSDWARRHAGFQLMPLSVDVRTRETCKHIDMDIARASDAFSMSHIVPMYTEQPVVPKCRRKIKMQISRKFWLRDVRLDGAVLMIMKLYGRSRPLNVEMITRYEQTNNPRHSNPGPWGGGGTPTTPSSKGHEFGGGGGSSDEHGTMQQQSGWLPTPTSPAFVVPLVPELEDGESGRMDIEKEKPVEWEKAAEKEKERVVVEKERKKETETERDKEEKEGKLVLTSTPAFFADSPASGPAASIPASEPTPSISAAISAPASAPLPTPTGSAVPPARSRSRGRGERDEGNRMSRPKGGVVSLTLLPLCNCFTSTMASFQPFQTLAHTLLLALRQARNMPSYSARGPPGFSKFLNQL
ncbi:hypothetical protein K438DRAFT_1775314 [Mycena galopus ATCC 62051]|nr:hypothetical protein K438DRAFT_1775314 [Mycena galopus ATCC 62051]